MNKRRKVIRYWNGVKVWVTRKGKVFPTHWKIQAAMMGAGRGM